MRSALSACLAAILLAACSPGPTRPLSQTLYAFRPEPPAILQLSADVASIGREIPLALPPDCAVLNLFPAPRGALLAVELSCEFGQAVLFLDTDAGLSGRAFPAFSEADSHFLSWDAPGRSVYLKVDSSTNPRVLRVDSGSLKAESIPVTEFTYDLAVAPDDKRFTFSFSRGMGLGSEIWLARGGGAIAAQLLADLDNYISFARWSPDGGRIAFVKIPDSQTPFTVGELWVMEADGSGARFLAEADAGHGYAPAWSPDGRRLAFVARSNPEDPRADLDAGALTSNIHVIDLETGEVQDLTGLEDSLVEAPAWSPDGTLLAFDLVLDGIINLRVVDAASGEIRSDLAAACCPAWLGK
jgi:Tol biopolymer transport system component